MRKSRQILMVAMVATALCADRAVQAAPELRTPVQPIATRIVRRLTTSFSHVVPNASMLQRREDAAPAMPKLACGVEQLVSVVRLTLSPFQFRLPPPIV